MNKLSELDKTEKIALLKAIAALEVDAKALTPDTIIVTNKGDWFLGMMASVSQASGEVLPVVFIGKALDEMTAFFKNIEDEKNH